MSLIGKALSLRNQSGKPPVPLDNGARAASRGNVFNLGSGRGDGETWLRQYGQSGTLFGIISLLAESVATPEWHLYRKTPVDGRRRYSTGDQGSDQRIEVIQHPAIALWNSPNAWHSRFEFAEGAQQHQELTGETIWVLDNEAGFPTTMWYVRPDRMQPVPDAENYLLGWIYTSPDGQQIPLKPEEVIQEKRPDPLDPYRGAGPVASILPNIQQQRYATEYQRNLFLNGADPGGVITVPNTLTEPQFDELVDRWRESHRGIARAGQIGVLENGATWMPGSHSNKDLEYGALRLANRDELREAWRIHKAMMGTSDDVNRANAQTAQEVFVAWQVLPRLNRRRDTLNNKLLPLYKGGGTAVEFDYDDPSPVNAENAAAELLSKAQAAQALVAAGYDPRDVLETVGLPDMDVADLPAAATPPPPPQLGNDGQNRARPQITMRRPLAATAPPPPETPVQQPTQQQTEQIDAQWKAAVALLVAAWLAHVLPGWHAALTGQVRQRVAEGNLPGLAALAVPPPLVAEAAETILDHTVPFAAAAAKQAADEAKAATGRATTPHPPARAALDAAARAAAQLAAQQAALSAGREASRIAGPGADADQVAEQVAQFLAGLSDAGPTAVAAQVMSAAQNQARIATIAAGPRAVLVASELNDTATCDACEKIDGHVFGDSDDPDAVAAATAAYPAGGYVLCEGGPRCRGTVFGVYGGVANRAPVLPRAGADAGAKAFALVADDYPPSAMAWMHHAAWSGPVAVPLDHIEPMMKWMDGASPDHVQDFVKRRQDGKKLKPVLLVKRPGHDKLLLVDGHHRYLAEAELGEPVRAYIGVVGSDEGPWETMHDQQYPGRGRGAAANALSAAATLSKAQVHYRDATETGRRCGTCSMFRGPDACTLVKGVIEASGVCDRWAARAAAADYTPTVPAWAPYSIAPRAPDEVHAWNSAGTP